jgi:hypothetical protein
MRAAGGPDRAQAGRVTVRGAAQEVKERIGRSAGRSEAGHDQREPAGNAGLTAAGAGRVRSGGTA